MSIQSQQNSLAAADISAGLPPFETQLSFLSLAQRSPLDAARSSLSSSFPPGAGIAYTLAEAHVKNDAPA